jgi:hypothetical protein
MDASGKIQAPAALLRKGLRYLLNKTLLGPQKRFGSFIENKSFASTWIRAPDRPARSQIVTPTMLLRLYTQTWQAKQFRQKFDYRV